MYLDTLFSTPSFLFSGYRGVKWPKREADHSPIFSTEVKNKWSHTPAPQYCFMVGTGTTCALHICLCPQYGMRPILMAAWHGHKDAVQMLINCGANVAAVNKVCNASSN